MSASGDALYLAWRYVSHRRVQTAILAASIAVVATLPLALQVLVARSADELMARAKATPLLVGARGSAIELVLSALYFASDPPAPMRYAEATRIDEAGLARAIPLHVRFHTRGHPIVGTDLAYLDFRGLEVAEGRRMAVLGECVVGASAARRLGIGPGDTLVSSPETAFGLAGVYPLEMNVVGVLAATYGPDDHAVFVDVKSAWVIEGLGHGHQDLASPDAEATVMKREGDRITANASVREFNRIDERNRASFHFHGDLSDYPVTAVLAVPPDAKSRALLMGRYEGVDEPSQIVRPDHVLSDLLDTVFAVQGYIVAAIAVAGTATAATTMLVFMLSFRLRRREFGTMAMIGGDRGTIALVQAFEVLLVGAFALAGVAILTALAVRFGQPLVRLMLAV